MTRTLLLPIALLLPTAAVAADTGERPAAEHRLSEAEMEAILDDAAAKREAAEDALPVPKRRVHGEVGFAVGTGGFRSIYGTSAVPLGEDGFAIISFENTDWSDRRGKRRHRR
jgi:hypothetical protein